MTSEPNSDPQPKPQGCVIAIDGPAASGKSSVSRELARLLDFVHVDTGAMYRAVTWLTLKHGVSPLDPDEVRTLLDRSSLQTGVTGHRSFFTLDGYDPTPHLRDESVNAAVSHIARLPEVRRRLVQLQRAYARSDDLVMEGRDIGSAVFPETPHKFYIDAAPEVRSGRRAAEGHNDEIAARDLLDASRKTSPLVVATDALRIDSSHLTIQQVVALILHQLAECGLVPSVAPERK